MKNKIFALGAGLMMLTAWSCREESDVLMTYDHDDALVFNTAKNSFADKFQLMWDGMNQYYTLWDYEAENGLDWDAIYDEYYPQFAALDQRGENETVTDDELMTLMGKVLGQLHDGHFHFDMMNHKTGSKVMCFPLKDKNAKRADFTQTASFRPNLTYFADPANNEIETDANGNPIYMEYSTNMFDVLGPFFNTPGIGYQWIEAKIQELEALTNPTEMQAFQLLQLKELYPALTQFKANPNNISLYNSLQSKYSFLNVPGFNYFEPGFAQEGIRFIYALLKGNIAYFHVSGFSMSYYLNEEYSNALFNMSNPDTKNHVEKMKQVWQAWYDAVQQLHKAGTLKGVIIDVRNNQGGLVDDYQYCVGALLPEGGLQIGYHRAKRGYGRYDYSMMMPAVVKTMSGSHEVIDDIPVVLLANCFTVSMGEMSTLGVKIMPNGTVVGKRTWGGLCPLAGNSYNSFNYSGHIGVDGVTPVYGYVPILALFSLDKKVLEGHGIEPDIEVEYNPASSADVQLLQALSVIRNGK